MFINTTLLSGSVVGTKSWKGKQKCNFPSENSANFRRRCSDCCFCFRTRDFELQRLYFPKTIFQQGFGFISL